MQTNQQPFFARGPSPLARLTVFGLAALVLMFVDSRFRTLDSVRSVIATIVHPMQRVAMLPLEAWRSTSALFESRAALQVENQMLRNRALADAQSVQGYSALKAENAQFRALHLLHSQNQPKGLTAEVIQSGRDPFAQRLFINRGSQQGIKAGQAVIDSNGVIGQVTRAHPLVSEVTLLTEKDHAVPVRNDRTSVRFVMFGRGIDQLPELRYVPTTVDIQVGDILTTSGIDGLYPAALAVAKITSVSREPGQAFVRVQCAPLAGIHASQYVLAVESPPAQAEIPAPTPEFEKSKSKSGVKK
jgi:rod shape-determining protein MreC